MKIECLVYLMMQFHFPEKFKAHKNTVDKYKKAGVFANYIETG
jgi:hypothetical protein